MLVITYKKSRRTIRQPVSGKERHPERWRTTGCLEAADGQQCSPSGAATVSSWPTVSIAPSRQILDTVVSRGETVAVERNSVPIAKIVPSDVTMTARQALAGLLPTLMPRQGAAWLSDSRAAFDETARDPWG